MGGILGSFGDVTAIALLAVAASGGNAEAAPQAVRDRDLDTELHALARRYNIQLIFDPVLVAGVKVAVLPAASAESALDQLLADTRFTYRRLPGGAFVIVGRTIKVSPEPAEPPPSAWPEIVIVGRRSQNVDLVRGEDEVQPYRIITADEIESSGTGSTDDFLRTRVTSNRNVAPLSQQGGSPRSQIDLRGLGPDQTLVLVDGRRFARIPVSGGLFGQSDVNAIPTEAIERVEILTSSAGGIFGIGATGGVANIILKRDYKGAFVSAERGVTDRGDGAEYRIYGRVSWTSPGGRTRIMASGSIARDDGLLRGDRSFAVEARDLRVASVGYGDAVVSNALNIRSADGSPLTFIAANGGTSLGSSMTYMPIGQSALNAGGVTTLLANAGKQDLSLAQDGQGAQASLIASAWRSSVVASMRQDLGSRSELFLDYLRFDDRGYPQTARVSSAATVIPAGKYGNPFNQDISVTYPTGIGAAVSPEYNLSQRASAGLIRRFSRGWSIEVDAAYSVTSVSLSSIGGGPSVTPRVFAGADALAADLQSPTVFATRSASTNRLIDANFRLTGSVASLPGGGATFTATGEFRREWSGGERTTTTFAGPGQNFTSSSSSSPYAQDVWSLFGEARLPILPADGRSSPWRGLSAQLALRLDRYMLNVPASVLDAIHNGAFVLAPTLGLQSRPLNGLMIRASYSTAAMPPTPAQLQARTATALPAGFSDPKRGGYQRYTPGYTFTLLYGSTSLKPQQTGSLSGGIVIDPDRVPGLRVSLDYTHLAMRHQIETFPLGDVQYFLDNEALLPGRVQRAALTLADQTAGYTGGRITRLDVGPLQTGRTDLDTLDLAANYDRRAGRGKLHLQADADWTLSYKRVSDPTAGAYNLVGYADGPIAWRANFAAEWSTEKWSIGSQLQLYSSYSLTDITPLLKVQLLSVDLSAADIEALQALEPRVPPQAYLNLSIAFRPQGKGGMQIRATVSNILDQRPPIAASVIPSPAASYIDTTPYSNVANYGDLLGRRLSVNVKIPFG